MVGGGVWCNECGVNSDQLPITRDPSHLRSSVCSQPALDICSQSPEIHLLQFVPDRRLQPASNHRDPTSSISTVGDFNFAVLWMVFGGEKMYAFQIYSFFSFK